MEKHFHRFYDSAVFTPNKNEIWTMKKTNRRGFIKEASIIGGGALLLASMPSAANIFRQRAADDSFSLPPLPYAYDALEPYIDSQTMQIHHGKHHQAYVNNLNKALAETPSLKGKSLDEIVCRASKNPEKTRVAIRNNAGGHWNHSFFWQILAAKPGAMSAELKAAIEERFHSTDNFKTEFEKAASSVFGSGWAWLVKKRNGKLEIMSTPNQDNPLMEDKKLKILMGVDVWEHAYYLKYQNKRADYLKAFWNVLDWSKVSAHFAAK
jgi:superoxide dismutase, Fe-Mn family